MILAHRLKSVIKGAKAGTQGRSLDWKSAKNTAYSLGLWFMPVISPLSYKSRITYTVVEPSTER